MAKPAPHIASATEYYVDVLCPQADDALRFATAVHLNRKEAADIVRKAFKSMADDVEHIDRNLDPKILVSTHVWHALKSAKDTSHADHDKRKMVQLLKKIDRNTRATVAAIDLLGFSSAQTSNLLDIADDEIRQALVHGRQTLLEAIGS